MVNDCTIGLSELVDRRNSHPLQQWTRINDETLFDFILKSNKKNFNKKVTITLICISFQTKVYLPVKFIL